MFFRFSERLSVVWTWRARGEAGEEDCDEATLSHYVNRQDQFPIKTNFSFVLWIKLKGIYSYRLTWLSVDFEDMFMHSTKTIKFHGG